LEMSSDGLELSKQRKLLEMQRRALMKSAEEAKPKETVEKKEENQEQILRKLFEGRAAEVYDAAKVQYPETTKKITRVLVELISKGELAGPISGEELFWLFRRLGANVRLETHIRFVESGKTKTIAEKVKGE
jgi:DNA-binding TFAR19-related protein (PDSD5 family)